MNEPRYSTIEGQRTLVVKRKPLTETPLPVFLGAMFGVTYSRDLPLGGWLSECEDRVHPFTPIRIGRHVGLDGVQRDVRVEMCPHCGAVCVRDISVDRIAGLPTGRGGPRRRNHIIGWYGGKSRTGREYR